MAAHTQETTIQDSRNTQVAELISKNCDPQSSKGYRISHVSVWAQIQCDPEHITDDDGGRSGERTRALGHCEPHRQARESGSREAGRSQSLYSPHILGGDFRTQP